MYKGKIILVTGSSRGVGCEIANYFLKNNSIVIGLSKGVSAIDSINYHHFSVDLSEPKQIIDLFKEISKRFKKIDILINNAAVLTSQYSMVMPVKNAIEMVNVDLLAVFLVSRESVKLMRKNSYGRIINISSMAVSLEPAGDSLYAACKAGVNTLANVMAKEYSALNITCNTLAITAFESDMLKQHSPTGQIKIKEIIKNLPIPRIAEKDDILNVIDFFSSERSGYITAQIIYLGGIN